MATLRIICPDRKGLVAAVGQLLYGYGINILDSDQHTDLVAQKFFQRVRMDLKEMHGDRLTLERAIQEVADRLDFKWQISYSKDRKRMAILVSKYDHCLHDLVLRQRAGELDCDIPLVISNHPDLEPVVKSYGLPFHVLPVTAETRKEQESAIAELVDREKVDLIVLARYMQVLSGSFCDRYAGRVINIHHSFLPAFVGGKPYHQAYERGVKLVGATAHFATSDLDQGPIIEQDVIRVTHRDSVRELLMKGRDLERMVLSRAVRYHL
jgi:formyltetrahydrofolate deformylase